jgi:transposase InsO family protein
MTDSDYELRRKLICDFRHSVVAELGNPYLSRGQLTRMIKEKSNREYEIPYSTKTSLTEGCIRRWLHLYRKFGKDGLNPNIRMDRGKSRIISDEEQIAIVNLLESDSKLTAIAAVRKLQEQGVIKKEITSSSLSRFVRSQDLTSAGRKSKSEKEKVLKFDFFSPLECIQVDVMYGPEIPDENGKLRKALLMAFLDDATRRIVYARFSFSEKSILFEDGIKHILKAQGMIGRCYTDNGSSFVSNQTERILNIVGVILTHSRVGIPKGRGKVERFFRTVRDQFTRPLDIKTVKNLDELNARFNTWLECEYHRSPHRGLSNNSTPLDAWIAKANHIKMVRPGVDLDRIFLHMETRKVYKDSTFTLKGTLYEAPSILAGKKIKIFYDPHPPVLRVLVSHGGKEYGDARIVDTYANSKVKRNYHSQAGQLDIEDESAQLPVNLLVTSMGGK